MEQNPDQPASLSDREHQVLELAAQGFIDQAIATKLGISMGTANTYWGRIRAKLGSVNRAELIANYVGGQSSEAIDQLRQENAALLAKLSQLDQRERQLDIALRAITAVVDTAPDAILIFGPEGQVRLANDAAESLFGYGSGEMLGLSLKTLVPQRFHGSHRRYREQYMKHPERRPMGPHKGTPAMTKDRREIHVNATLSACKSAGGLVVTCILRKADPISLSFLS